MAAQAPPTAPVGPDSPITVKVAIDGTNRRFKMVLRDLGAQVLPQKLRFLLAVPPEAEVVFERFSDSAATYVTLDSSNPAIYKQLYRAAKAKSKLRIKATVTIPQAAAEPVHNLMDEHAVHLERVNLPTYPRTNLTVRHNYLDTVLSPQEPKGQSNVAEKPTFWPAPTFASPQLHSGMMSLPNRTSETPSTPVKSVKNEQNQPEHGTASSPSGDYNGEQPPCSGTFCIDCNHCGESIRDEHYHCDICDDGDFDLCCSCVTAGHNCQAEGHWLIKRRIQNGGLISSVTETIAPKKWQEERMAVDERVAQKLETRQEGPPSLAAPEESHTCNSCINKLPKSMTAHCTYCRDYHLCFVCLSLGDHGHNPAHPLMLYRSAYHRMSPNIRALCRAGRGYAHAAICDRCDKHIYGVRHKCQSCPDFDYCNDCIDRAAFDHPGHRFAALFEPLLDLDPREEVHIGIFCDSPLCSGKPEQEYIQGIRYKCAICDDTDFCANCEASPRFSHNRTHPLIKFKTPVRHVSVTTLSEDDSCKANTGSMGDRPSARHVATETVSTEGTINTATPVQTVAEVRPIDTAAAGVENDGIVQAKPELLQAHFERELTADGSNFVPGRMFFQVWTIRNPGPEAWPAGCAVCFTGGDHMLDVDSKKPSSVTSMEAAFKSNTLRQSLEPGMSADFVILLKAPEREGRAISYWRLKTAESFAFGCQLWVDINVTGEADVPEKEEMGEPGPEQPSCEAGPTEESSHMVFPKLDKESPETSTHHLPRPASGRVGSESPQPKVEEEVVAEDAEAEEELADDLERLDLEASDESDGGFLTDEEYDILDASDEDLLMEMHKPGQK